MQDNEGKYLKGIFIGIVTIAVILLAAFIALVFYLNRPSSTDGTASIDTIKESIEYVPQSELPTNEIAETVVTEEEVPLTQTIEDADNDSIPAYADEELDFRNMTATEIYKLQLDPDAYNALLDTIDTVEECDEFLAIVGLEDTITLRKQKLLKERESASEDTDAQACIDKLNYIINDIAELNASNYILMTGTADTDAFQNSFISFLLPYDLYSDEFMADYAYYLSELSLDERIMEHVYTRCSYPYTPFFTDKCQLIENIYCKGSEIMYVNDEKIVKATIYTPDGDSYAYFKNYDGNWKIYHTEFTPVYGNGITKDIYKNKTP